MTLRFRKSVKIAPGIKVNIGKKSAGISIGGKGYHQTFNTSGRKTTTVGIPGTGLSYSASSNISSRQHNNKASYSKTQQISHAIANESDAIEENRKNSLLVEEYENRIDTIRNIHQKCSPTVFWKRIQLTPEPFALNEKGPKEIQAQKDYDDFKPNIINKLIKSSNDKRRQQLLELIDQAKESDRKDYDEWRENVTFAKDVLAGDIDAYYAAIEKYNPFNDLVELGSGFEFGTDDASKMEIEFLVKSESVVPNNSLSLTKNGKISEKPLSKTQYYDITQDYVCSCSIRLARELFALLPIDTVIVHATDNILNTATGNEELCTILSVKFLRSGFKSIKFNNIDASDFVESFEHNMCFKKTLGFKPVEQLL